MAANHNSTEMHGTLTSTTDNTQTVAATFETQTDYAYWVEARVLATETTDHDETASYWRQACFRNDGGTVTQVGSTRTVVTDNETTAGWDVDFNISGTAIRLRVTGANSTNIRWLTDLSIKKLT